MDRKGATKAHTKMAEAVKKDRKSQTGVPGDPKKGGHGGKFTWSGDQIRHDDALENKDWALDSKDPNFEDPVEEKAM